MTAATAVQVKNEESAVVEVTTKHTGAQRRTETQRRSTEVQGGTVTFNQKKNKPRTRGYAD